MFGGTEAPKGPEGVAAGVRPETRDLALQWAGEDTRKPGAKAGGATGLCGYRLGGGRARPPMPAGLRG